MNAQFTPKEVIAAIKANDRKILILMLRSDFELLHLNTPLGSWLHIATEYSKMEIIELLLELGINVNVKGGPSGGSPLNIAASEGNVELVQYFLEYGAEMDISEPERNPLFSAIHYGRTDVVKLLLNAGIDVQVKYSGKTMKDMDALAFAKEWGRAEIASIVEYRIEN